MTLYGLLSGFPHTTARSTHQDDTHWLQTEICRRQNWWCKLRWSTYSLENCALLGYYAASSGNSLTNFRDNLSVPSSRVKNPRRTVTFPMGCTFCDFRFNSLLLKMGPIGCPETSVRNHHYSLRNNPKERSSHLLRDGSLKSGVPPPSLSVRLAFILSWTD
jgi:hypothetical protein